MKVSIDDNGNMVLDEPHGMYESVGRDVLVPLITDAVARGVLPVFPGKTPTWNDLRRSATEVGLHIDGPHDHPRGYNIAIVAAGDYPPLKPGHIGAEVTIEFVGPARFEVPTSAPGQPTSFEGEPGCSVTLRMAVDGWRAVRMVRAGSAKSDLADYAPG